MRCLLFIPLVLVFLGSGDQPKPPSSPKDAAIQEELARFQGTWQLLFAETNGENAPEERVRQIRVTIAGNTHTVRLGERVLAHDVSFEIDPTKTPKEVTDTIHDGPDKGKAIRGIYKLSGDMLLSCVGQLEKERPSDFSAKPGSGHTLRIFGRVRPGDDAKAQAIKAELERFEGTWSFASIEIEGRPLPEDAFHEGKLVMKGNRFDSVTSRATSHGVFQVDPTVTPKTIDVTLIEGAAPGTMHHGIYELEGDTYKICMGPEEKPRPTEFASKPGSGLGVQVLKREKP
jgi:uncharacterized protein (TIGR03067 family)